MSTAVEALRADRAALLEICAGLSAEEWASESGCAGWSVQDVVAHMGALFAILVDPSRLPDTAGLPTERAQNIAVESRRSWSSAEVLSDYESVSSDALGVLAGFDGQEYELPLGDLGTYALSVLPSAYAFDHYTHIRADLFAPRGPLGGEPPESDELRLAPAIDWIEAAISQQNAGVLGSLDGALDIVVHGPGGRTIRLGAGDTVGEVRSSSSAFVRWVTQRATWEAAGAQAVGDESALAIARRLRVF
ncbi:MAG: maleylpyruvate isomerase family mycothiol-dependent enzyme [Acidimicrobiales bacterium]|jgi:uncharacterized protein (TIGR03083 family)